MHTAMLTRAKTHADHLTSTRPTQAERSVIVIGRPTDLRFEITRELAQNNVSPTVLDHRASTTTTTTDSIRGSPTCAADSLNPTAGSMIIITAHPRLPRNRRGLCQLRARAVERIEQQRLTALAVSAASTTSTCRILVLCDVRQATTTTDAARWAKQLAVGIGYEAQINGASVDSTSYLIVGRAISVARAAQLAAQWHHRPDRAGTKRSRRHR